MTDTTYDRSGSARQALLEIYRDYGLAGLDNDVVVNQLLPDQLPNAPREASAVRAAASVGVAGLLNARFIAHIPVEAAVRDVAGIMMERHALDQFACLWIVSEYAVALGHPPSAPILPQPRDASAPATPTRTTAVHPAPAGFPAEPVATAYVVRTPVEAPTSPVVEGGTPNRGSRKPAMTALIVSLVVAVLLLAVDVITGWPPPLTGDRTRTISSPSIVPTTLVRTATVYVTVGPTLTAAEQSLVGKISDSHFTGCRPASRPNLHVVAAVSCGAIQSGTTTDPLIMTFDTRAAMDAYLVSASSAGTGICQSFTGYKGHWDATAGSPDLGGLDCYRESSSYKIVWSYYSSDIVIAALGSSGSTLFAWWGVVCTTAVH